MPFQNKEIRTLTRLGLTSCQAKVYLALVRSGISTAKTISMVSKVARPDIYRIMPMLQKLGLAEKIINVPTKFEATPIREGVTSLLDHKSKETYELQQEAKELLKKFKERQPKTPIQEGDKQLVLIPERERLILSLKKAAEDAQSSMDIICPQEAFPKGLLIMNEVYEKAMGRGVKIRWLLEKPKDINPWPEIVQTFMKNPFFKLRIVLKPPEARLGIFDKKEVFIATHPTTRAMESTALWTNNPSLLRIVHDYFERLWITALENLDEEQPITNALV